ALIALPPGRHTLQFVLVDASGIPFKPLVQSDVTTITVKDTAPAAAANNGSKEAADAKAAQDSRKATEAQQAAEAKQAQEAKAAQEAREAQEAKAKLAAE